MSGRAPEGRAAGENENENHANAATADVSRGGPSDSHSTSNSNGSTATASYNESPPPIPPNSTPLSAAGGGAVTPAEPSAGVSEGTGSSSTGEIVTPASAITSTSPTAAATVAKTSPPSPSPSTSSSPSPILSDTASPVLEPITTSSPAPSVSSERTDSPDPATTHPASHPFAERFLPSHVDASHVISSAAPTSLPIELPAIRAENVQTPPTSSSTSEALSSSSSGAAASPGSASGRPVSANAANLQLLTPFQRWTLRASESQFNALAGAVGGFTSGVFTCPLDVIKTKLQAQGGFTAQQAAAATSTATATAAGQSHHRLYNGLVGTARVIWRDEGVRGLYRGLGPIIMGYLPTWAVWFTVYNKSKIWLSERHHIENTFVINFWSSVVAGASSTIVTNPIWVIKTRLMSQMPRGPNGGNGANGNGGGVATATGGTPTSRPTLSTPWHYRSTLDAARKMYTTEGVLSFYSGLTPALLGLTHVAVQFPAYEYFKTKFTGRGMGESPGDGEAPAHWLGVLSATILSKVLASSLTYPHEVIRTRLQTQRRSAAKSAAQSGGQPAETPRYRGIVTTFRTILREEGWRAFYAGMGTNMMRAVPAATVTMLTYEYVMRSLKQKRHDARQVLEGH